jgi:cell division septation protein DedD
MSSTTRKARNYKEKSPMLAFGHIVLPLAAVIAVGLLFIGIKLFFLSPPDSNIVEIMPQTPVVAAEPEEPVRAEPTPEPVEAPVPAESVPASRESVFVAVELASPISQTSSEGASSVVRTTSPSRAGRETTPSASRASSRPSSHARSLTSKYGVQIGAFTREEGAKSVVNEVTKQGYTAAVSVAESSGKTYHRVRVAAGNTKEEADRFAAELKQKGYPVLVVTNP